MLGHPFDKVNTIYYQGEPGAYSDLASKILFPADMRRIGLTEFSDVFSAILTNGEKALAILPIENSIHGSVHPVYDLLQKHHFFIQTEFKLRIEHCLLANYDTVIGSIKEVYSHPQAIGQCASFFVNHPQIHPVPWYDTAGSAKFIAENKSNNTIAAIASREAAKVYGLDVLLSNIESFEHNFTRFIVVSLLEHYPTDADKTALILETNNDPGALYKCLGVFAGLGIDLLKIESRPVWGKPWKHLFYLDIRGSYLSGRVKEAVRLLGQFTEYTRILGSFKEDRSEEGHGTAI